MLHNFDVDPEASALTAVIQGGCEDAGEPSVHTCLFWGSTGISFGQGQSRVTVLRGCFAWPSMTSLI